MPDALLSTNSITEPLTRIAQEMLIQEKSYQGMK